VHNYVSVASPLRNQFSTVASTARSTV